MTVLPVGTAGAACAAYSMARCQGSVQKGMNQCQSLVGMQGGPCRGSGVLPGLRLGTRQVVRLASFIEPLANLTMALALSAYSVSFLMLMVI